MSRLLAEEGLREALWDRGLDETPGVTLEYEQVTWTVPSTGVLGVSPAGLLLGQGVSRAEPAQLGGGSAGR